MGRPASQIALPLPPAREGDPEHIVIGTANAGVVEALRAPASWPFRTAILRGPPRSGTSLLGRWFEHAGLGETIDPADAIDETALFHRWNRAQEEGTALLLIPGSAPWEIALPDLRSRLGAALALEIAPPDDQMMRDLILSHAERRGLVLPTVEEVLIMGHQVCEIGSGVVAVQTHRRGKFTQQRGHRRLCDSSEGEGFAGLAQFQNLFRSVRLIGSRKS